MLVKTLSYLNLQTKLSYSAIVTELRASRMATTSSSFEANLNTAKTVLSTTASLAATLMLARSVARDLLPRELHDNFFWGIRSFFSRFSSQLTMVISEFNSLESNQIYDAAHIYLASKVSPSTQRIKVSKSGGEKSFIVSLEGNEEVTDVFNGVKFKWVLICTRIEPQSYHNPRDFSSSVRSEVRSFELSFHKKHREMALESYLPYIVKEAKSMKQEIKTLKIFTVDYQNMYNISNLWISTNLDHPATFDKLAMESEIKEFILKDLELFVRRKEFYRKVGKAWKRGYLLYGPPGTGKSSLIAAMANYLKFDIYDLELTELRQNSDLRKLLITIANRSILVVEDIDCTIDFHDRAAHPLSPIEDHYVRRRRQEVTLSGLLNFIDGLWSSCGDERVIVFTTNRKEKLDPALLRPGRMDVHVHMSYCTPCGFRLLANNYLGLKNHPLFSQIEDAILDAQVTPAEVAEQLLKGEDGDAVLRDLPQFLSGKKKEQEEAMAEKVRQELEKKNSLQVGKDEEKKKDDDGENIN